MYHILVFVFKSRHLYKNYPVSRQKRFEKAQRRSKGQKKMKELKHVEDKKNFLKTCEDSLLEF